MHSWRSGELLKAAEGRRLNLYQDPAAGIEGLCSATEPLEQVSYSSTGHNDCSICARRFQEPL